MTAGETGRSLRDRPHLLRPGSWSDGSLEVVLLGVATAWVLTAFAIQFGVGALASLTPIGVVPVLATAWLGSQRVLLAVLGLSVVLDVVLAVHSDIGAGTAATRAIVMVGLGLLALLASRGYAGTHAAASRLGLVSRVSRIATSALSLDAILAGVLSEMAREGLRGGVILLIDDNRQLYIAAAQGELDESVRNSRLDVGEGIMGGVAATGRAALVDDIDAPDAPRAANRHLGTNAKMRSLVAVPLLSAGTPMGVLAVDSQRPHAFDADDLAMMEQIAVAIVGSVQRAGALQLADRRLQQRVDELILLLDTAGRLSMSLEPDVVMQEVVRSTAAVVSHGSGSMRARASVFRVAEDRLQLIAADDADEFVAVAVDLPLEEHHFARQAMSSGAVVTGRLDETGPTVAAAAARLGLVSGAWAPIWTGKSLYGVLAATSRDQRDFDSEELRLLEGIAHLAGLAIGNAESLRLERERVVAAREHAERMASVERVKSEFLRLASHELRGPLGVVSAYVSMLVDGSLPDAEMPRVLPVLSGKVAEMHRLVDQMRETPRLEEGRRRLETERVDLGRMVAEAVHAVLPLGAPQHEVVIDVRDHVAVVADHARILTVLANLVGNAVKYSPGGGRVLLTVSAEEGSAVVRVADEGIGIAAEDMPRLFTRFGRVVTRENSHIAGTGLGLYLSRELARLHGGDITVSSTAGKGSVFTFTLPLAGPGGEVRVLRRAQRPQSDADDLREAAER